VERGVGRQHYYDLADFIGIISVEDASTIQYEPIPHYLSPEDEGQIVRKLNPKIIERIFSPKYVYKFQPIQSLKGDLSAEADVYAGGTDCDLPNMEVGGIYRISLYKHTDGKLNVGGICTNPVNEATWNQALDQVLKNSQIMKRNEECKKEGRAIGFVESKVDCIEK
jgi:hypothetical protein